MVSSPIEHPAVAEPVARLEADGFAVDRPAVDATGVADAERMAACFRPETRLATLMLANNETGAIQPVARLAALGRARACRRQYRCTPTPCRPSAASRSTSTPWASPPWPPAHTSSTARWGSGCFWSAAASGSALGSSAGASSRGEGRGPSPCRWPSAWPPRWNAGRPRRRADRPLVGCWRNRLEAGLIAALGPGRVVRNGPSEPELRLPQTVNLGFPGLDGDALLMQLDLAGIAASLGSACASGSTRPSPTLVAMRVPEDRLRSSVRFSLGATTSAADIETAVERISTLVGIKTEIHHRDH